MSATCPQENTANIDQSSFWDDTGIHLDYHRIGWIISGSCAILTSIITIFSVISHARHYYIPAEQRQIIRILYMPPVFAIISFFSYRFFRSYTYYSLVQVVYESFVLSAFLLLIVQYVANTADSRTAEGALARKDKTRLIIPLCCIRYRPTKPYFMYTLKWSVMQYTILCPACSIAGIITQYYGVLCEGQRSVYFAAVYLEAVDFVSISIALMGLVIFYDLTKNELKGRRPLAKFLCIKLIVMVTWYQSFLFSILQTKGVIKATEFWTSSNVADGLNALCTSVEMVFFAVFMQWAYPASEYYDRDPAQPQERGYISSEIPEDEKTRKVRTTSVWRPLWDSINFSDFALEIWSSFMFFVDYIRRKPYTRSRMQKPGQITFGQAFGIEGPRPRKGNLANSRESRDQADMELMRSKTPTSAAGTFANGRGSRGAASDERTLDTGMGEAYGMSSITSQPRPRQPPEASQDQQGLEPPQIHPEQRWSTVGVAM